MTPQPPATYAAIVESTAAPFGANITTDSCDYYRSLVEAGNLTFSHIPRDCFRYSDSSRVLIGLILGLLAFFTAVGNALVIMAVGLVKKLQTPSNLLIVSLAVSDFSVSLLVLPFAAIKTLAEGMWPLSHRICDLFIIFDVLLCTSSILNLCAISIDRYLVITRPFSYAPNRTPARMAVMILVAWVTSALISIPPVFGWKKPHKPGYCEISDDLGYQIYATFGAFYVPLIVMLVLYGRIFKLAHEMAKADAKQKPTFTTAGGEAAQRLSADAVELPNGATAGAEQKQGGSQRPSFSDHFPTRNRHRQGNPRGGANQGTRRKSKSNSETKAIKTLGVIMGCFTLCWLPFFIMQLMSPIVMVAQVKNFYIPPDLVSIFVWLGYMNSFLNPIIYAKFNRDFRTPFKEILMFRCGSINARLRSESYAEQYGLPMHSMRRDSRQMRRKSSDMVTKVNRKGKVTNSLGNGTSTEHV